jgi:hypothetical protein
MPSSLRHRSVKFHEEVVRIRNLRSGQQARSAGNTWFQRVQAEKKPS